MRLERLDILNATLALVAVINPLGNLPVFVELTSDLNKNTPSLLKPGSHHGLRDPHGPDLYVGHTRGDEAVKVKEINFQIRCTSLPGG